MIRRFSEKYGEAVLLLVLIVTAIYLITVGLEIPVGRGRSPVTPATWPVMSLGIIVGCSALLLIFRLINRNKNAAATKASAEDAIGDPAEEAEEYPQRALYTIIFMVVYLVGIPYTGFLPVTLVALGLYMVSIGCARKYAVIIPLLMTALITVIFGIALKVPLPRGIGLFREFSMLFY